MQNRILAISPHTDDIELGCGGTINKFTQEGKEVYCVVLSDCKDAIPAGFNEGTLSNECIKSLMTLGVKRNNIEIFNIQNKNFPANRQKILEILEKIKEEVKPELIIIPSLNETHQDHKTTAEEAIRAFRNTTSIICYEQPWNNLKFNAKFFVKLSKEDIDNKLKALKQYKSQLYLERRYFDEDFLIGLAIVRGTQIKERYAEAFEVVRLIK